MPVQFSSLPVTLGVTGHRDVQDTEQLLTLLESEISAIQTRYPHSPVMALSSLAEGADRLFARVIMEKRLPLHVVLPFAKEEYERDFAATVDEFRELYDYAQKTGGIYCIDTVIPGSEPMISLDQNPQGSLYRDLQYAKAGMYLAQRCHILFALWDGEKARGLGGTAQVVNFRREGRIQDHDLAALNARLPGIKRYLGQSSLLDVPDTGLVCHIHVRRKAGTYANGATSPSVSWYPPLPVKGKPEASSIHGEESWYRSLERMDMLNARVAKEDDANSSLGTSHLCHAAFAHIDRLANKEMKDMRKVYNLIFGLAAVMALVGNRVPGDGEHWVITSLSLSLLLLVLLSVALSRVHSSRANRNATELRALAEGLRVQNVWRQAGIARAVSLHYLRRSHDNIAWVRRAMLAASIYPQSDASTLKAAIDGVKESWVRDQKNYFEKNVHKKERKHRLAKRMAFGLFICGIAITSVVLASSLWGLTDEHLAHTLHFWNMVGEHLAEFLIACAALCAAYAKFLGYEEDIADYERSAVLFSTALEKMEAHSPTPDTEDLQETLYALGIETLQENARWVARTTGRDVEIIGG